MEGSASAAGIFQRTWGRIRVIPRSASAATKQSPKSREANRDRGPHSRWQVPFMIVPRRLRWLWLTLAAVFLDRASKAWFETQTAEGWRHEVIHNFFYLVHTKNPGIAFSLFANSPSPSLRILLIAGALVIIGLIAWLLVAGP